MTIKTEDGVVQSKPFQRADLALYLNPQMHAEPIREIFDWEKEHEVQTDKDRCKLVPCRECRRPLVVSTFYVPAWARCAACKGSSEGASTATVAVPQPGRTDPAKAINLKDCLINPAFGRALCPVHPDDDSHEMELLSVSHSEGYGPYELIPRKGGGVEYRQTAPGETVLHQCRKCLATVSYSTTAQMQLCRQNEIRDDKHVNGWVKWLGAKQPPPGESS